MILVTGSRGLIGSALGKMLDDRAIAWRSFDIRDDRGQDTRDAEALCDAMHGVDGVVHLAAISRVVWAEQDPSRAQRVNVDALDGLLRLATTGRDKPWVVFASSREVYGEQESLPASEDAPLKPMNTYARSKVAGERMVEEAREAGLLAQIVRFSNVYGSTEDHEDRVVPAFARSAARGGSVRVDGPDNTFDFTNIDDVARGLAQVCEATMQGEQLPPIHFLTGRGTTLGELAELAAVNARHPISVTHAPSRAFDVSRFYGDPERARGLLGWTAEVSLERGFADLVARFETEETRAAQTESRAEQASA